MLHEMGAYAALMRNIARIGAFVGPGNAVSEHFGRYSGKNIPELPPAAEECS